MVAEITCTPSGAYFCFCLATVVLMPVEAFYLGLVCFVSVRPVTVKPVLPGPVGYLFSFQDLVCLITAICVLMSYGCVFVITSCRSELRGLYFPPVMNPASSREFCSLVLNIKYSAWRAFRNGAVCVTSIHIYH